MEDRYCHIKIWF